MSHDMFGEIVRPSVRVGSRAWYTVPLSVAVHIALAAVVVVVPLMATDVLPKPTSLHKVFVGDAPAPPPPPPVAPPSPAHVPRARVNPDAAPVNPPDTIEKEIAVPSLPNVGPVAEGGLPAGLVGETGIEVVSPVIPVPPPSPVPPKPVPVGGRIAVPTKIRDVRPVYPSIAQAAKVSGTVIIAATIGADGRVNDARIIKSVALLDQAALDAVKQWQFSPTRLNGVPIPVIMTVTVNFALQ
jgi:periplasmic protein TonB